MGDHTDASEGDERSWLRQVTQDCLWTAQAGCAGKCGKSEVELRLWGFLGAAEQLKLS